MKNKILAIIKYLLAFTPFILVLYTVTTSLDWGLPTQEIHDIVLPKDKLEKTKVITNLVEMSDKSIKTRSTFVIEGKDEKNIRKEQLRIARRFLIYSENPDEMLAIAGLSGINPRKLKFKPKCYHYGGGYLYPMGGMIALGQVINKESLNISTRTILSFPENMATLYIWGRALNLFALLICFLGLLLIFSSNEFTTKIAIFASGIIMTSPVIINWATILKPHFFGTAFLILSIGLVLIGEKKDLLKKYYFISMFFAGFAASAQYLMVGAGIIPSLIIIKNRKYIKIEKCRIIALGTIISGITFFLFNPYHLFNINDVLLDLKRAGSFYSPEFFNAKTPFFALWMWGIGTGFLVFPFVLGLLYKFDIKSFVKKYNYLIIAIIIFGYYGSIMCVSTGFQAIMARFFIPMIILISILFMLKIHIIQHKKIKKVVFACLVIAGFTNIYMMKTIFNEGSSISRPYIKASNYLNKMSKFYNNIYTLYDTPAPFKTPAFNINTSVQKWNNILKENELLITNKKINNLKLVKSFIAEHRYYKMSFGEKDFFFYENTK